MSVGFHALAFELGVRVQGRPHTGESFVAKCPACGDGRLLAWTWRPGDRRWATPGFSCWDCGQDGDLLRLDRRIRRSDA